MPNGDEMEPKVFQHHVIQNLEGLQKDVGEIKDDLKEFKREHKSDVSAIYNLQRICRSQVDVKFEAQGKTVAELIGAQGGRKVYEKLIMAGLTAVIGLAGISLVKFLLNGVG